jgi:hypothetical protein
MVYGRNILKAILLVFFSVVVALFDIRKEASYVQIETGMPYPSLKSLHLHLSHHFFIFPFHHFHFLLCFGFRSQISQHSLVFLYPRATSPPLPVPSTLYQFLPPCVLLIHYCGKRWPLPFLSLCGLSQPASTGLHLHPSASKSTRGVPF